MSSKKIENLELSKEIKDDWLSNLKSILNYEDTLNKLHHELANYELSFADAQSKNEFLDVEKGRDLLKKSKAMLDLCKENLGQEYIPYVLAAVSYLIETDDASPDFTSVDGFDDDEEVIEKTINHFQLQEIIDEFLKKG